MKRTSYIALATLLCVTSCIQHRERTSLEEMNLKGDVASVTDSIWYVDFCGEGNALGDELLGISHMEFNDDGQVIERLEYDGTGGIIGRESKSWESRYVPKESLFCGEDGLLSEKKTYTSENGLISQEVVQYYENGKAGRSVKIVNKYDDKGRICIKEKIDGRRHVKSEFNYLDANGSYEELVTCDNGVEEKRTTMLNERGEMRSYEIDESLITYEYDEKGNVCREMSAGVVNICEYTYDERGNWTTRLVYILEDNSKIGGTYARRTIVYKN